MSRAKRPPRARALPVRAALVVLVAFVAFFTSALRAPSVPDVPRAVASIAAIAARADAPSEAVTSAERPAVLRRAESARPARGESASVGSHDVLAPAFASPSLPAPRAALEARLAAFAARPRTSMGHVELMVFLN